ncbi:MAG: ABC transporter permease [Methanotrichaceae archaeon]|nr:ABC transporter permease [Methanotrichaceae archaeon]
MFEIFIAQRHILANRRYTILTLLSVAIAVGVIIMSLALNEGSKADIITTVVENSPHIIVEPKEDEDYIHLHRTLSGTIQKYPEVLAVSPRLIGEGAARYKEEVASVRFIGIDPDAEEATLKVQKRMIYGSISELRFRRSSAVLGKRLAEYLGIKAEDSFYLTYGDQSMKLRVAGIIEKGTGDDWTLVYIGLKAAQDLMGEGDVVSEIGARVGDIYDAPAIVSDLKMTTEYNAKSWQDISRDLTEFVETLSKINFIFYLLMFVISGFVVANTAIMTVSRRTKEIGMLMAMGASRRSILRIFLLENIMLSPSASLLGCLLGYLGARLINSFGPQGPQLAGLSSTTAVLRAEFFAYAVAFAMLLSLLAGIYPAYAAARLDPVEAIASE